MQVDAINHWAQKVRELEAAVGEARQRALRSPPTTSFFVFFNDQRAATVAAQVHRPWQQGGQQGHSDQDSHRCLHDIFELYVRACQISTKSTLSMRMQVSLQSEDGRQFRVSQVQPTCAKNSNMDGLHLNCCSSESYAWTLPLPDVRELDELLCCSADHWHVFAADRVHGNQICIYHDVDSFDMFLQAPGPEEVNWPTLWEGFRGRNIRACLTAIPIAAMIIFPIGIFAGAVWWRRIHNRCACAYVHMRPFYPAEVCL